MTISIYNSCCLSPENILRANSSEEDTKVISDFLQYIDTIEDDFFLEEFSSYWESLKHSLCGGD